VEHGRRRIEAEFVVGADRGRLPAPRGRPLDLEHVVGKGFAKDELVVRHAWARRRRLGDAQLLGLSLKKSWWSAHKKKKTTVETRTSTSAMALVLEAALVAR